MIKLFDSKTRKIKELSPDIITAVERMLDNVKAEIKGFEEM